ncbi:lectin-like protein [Fuerstiella marisgermanici]|uniref:Lectin C-type domain protein n=1 Tax=Fuerstiella marisgermanici TaxID=1891926 RepID=A0A1P8WPK0_9PLAN|nr:lectin-like protein [Fuerstiella marisgermanici]APZ95973.1 Lectin C-type domain protein [Fuerstiella marisgermanici]
MIRFIFIAILFASSSKNLDAGIIHTAQFGGNTYHLLDADGTKWWLDAEAEAVTLGGHLATINSQAENDFVFNTFSAVAENYAIQNNLPVRNKISLWIGLSDHVAEGDFIWASGEISPYSNFAPGEPASGHAGEDWVGMFANWGAPSLWHDIFTDPGADLPFGVVEVSASPVPEPSSAFLLFFAVPVCLYRRMRRRGSRRRSGCAQWN